MRIAITDVTRMAEGYCCVAGIDRDTGEHIVPCSASGCGAICSHRAAR